MDGMSFQDVSSSGEPSIIHLLGSMFDECDETNIGEVVVAKLFTYIAEHFVRNDFERMPSENILCQVYNSLDPNKEGCKVDKSTWLAAWKHVVDSEMNNNNGSSMGHLLRDTVETNNLDSSYNCLNESKQSFTSSPGPIHTSTPDTDEKEIKNLKDQICYLTKLNSDLEDRLRSCEEALAQEYLHTNKLEGKEKDHILDIERLKQQVSNLKDLINELEFKLSETEYEKLELCKAVSAREDEVKRVKDEAEALQTENNLLSTRLSNDISEIESLSRKLEERHEEISLLRGEKERMIATLNELGCNGKMHQNFQNDNSEQPEPEPQSLLAEGIYLSLIRNENTPYYDVDLQSCDDQEDEGCLKFCGLFSGNYEDKKSLYEELLAVDSELLESPRKESNSLDFEYLTQSHDSSRSEHTDEASEEDLPQCFGDAVSKKVSRIQFRQRSKDPPQNPMRMIVPSAVVDGAGSAEHSNNMIPPDLQALGVQNFNLKKIAHYFLILFFFFLLLIFSTILCTAAALDIAAESGIVSFPMHGSSPKWIRSILRPFLGIRKYTSILQPF